MQRHLRLQQLRMHLPELLRLAHSLRSALSLLLGLGEEIAFDFVGFVAGGFALEGAPEPGGVFFVFEGDGVLGAFQEVYAF